MEHFLARLERVIRNLWNQPALTNFNGKTYTHQKEYQAKIDAILDKISKSGYDGLTAEEKQLLFDASHRRKK